MLGHGQIGLLALGQLPPQPGETITPDKWLRPFSEPVRTTIKAAMVALAASGGVLVESAPFPETVTESRWHQPFSEPVRLKPSLITGAQQALSFHPRPFVSFSWFEPLSEPVRLKPRLPEGEQQFLALHPAPSPFVATGWFESLSEPVRFRPALPATEQHYFELEPTPIISISWFMPFMDPPVLAKVGLRTEDQQFFATWFTFTTQFTLAVTETADVGALQLEVFAGGLTRALVSITEVGYKRSGNVSSGGLIPGANVSIYET